MDAILITNVDVAPQTNGADYGTTLGASASSINLNEFDMLEKTCFDNNNR